MEGGVFSWKVDGHASPAEDLMPNLTGERAGLEEVMNGLGFLITKRARVLVRQAVTGEPFRVPAAVLHGKPKEELDAKRRPWPAGETPVRIFARAKEKRLVAGARRVCGGSCPTPGEHVWRGGERRVAHQGA